MRIGVDATCWHNRRGYGRHARALLHALLEHDPEGRYTLFVDSDQPAEPFPTRASVRLVASSAPAAVAASANGRRSLGDLWRMSRALASEPFDLLLFPTIYSYVPVFSRARKLVMIHDVIAETYPSLTVPRLPARLFWKAKVAAGRVQADALVTVSEYSRRGVIKRFGVSPENVYVVGEAGDAVFRVCEGARLPARLASLGIDPARRIVAYVGGFSPHKNLEELIAAFAAICRRGFQDAQLVMVGDYRGDVFLTYFGTVKAAVQRAGIGEQVIFPGFVPDEELASLLNVSTVLVLPSLMEGFGLPAIEAAACGCPVIATRHSPLPDLLGDGAVYMTPGANELEEALARVLSSASLRAEMRQAGIAAARRLTWEAAARQMMAVMQEVALR
jgi:glycosyltransferase involved in cell wall biosynthesis